VGVKHSDLLLKVFLLRLGVGGGIKKFSAVKISVQGLGACGSGRDMFSGQVGFFAIEYITFEVREREAVRDYVQRSGFFADEYITFQGGQMCPRSVCCDLLIM
jgi:hypothetical protein